MERINLEEIAYENGLELGKCNSNRDGFPEYIKPVLYGFENFAQAKKLAEKYSLDIIQFKRRIGQDLWSRQDYAYQPFNMAENALENDMIALNKNEIIFKNFMENYINPVIEEYNDIDKNIVRMCEDNAQRIMEALEDMNDDEIVLCSQDGICIEYAETIKAESMRFSEDSTEYLIGLIKTEKNEVDEDGTIYAFGEPVPESVIEEMREEFPNKEITTELIEDYYHYEYMDCRND